MYVEFTVDWYSGTGKSDDVFELIRELPVGVELTSIPVKARFGYSAAVKYESGVEVYWHEERIEMGCHVVMSGSALRALQENGEDSFSVLSACNRLNIRCSRVDLAVDVHDSGLRQVDLCKPNRKPYKGKGRKPKFTAVGDQEDGWTLYVGSRSSEKFLRIYDKGKESKLKDADFVRIEIECKGGVAHWLGSELPTKDATGAYVLASTLIKTLIDFDHPIWERALSAESVEFSIPKKTSRDTLNWLVKTCAPALARLVAEKPSEDMLELFAHALRWELRKLGVEVI